jgi:hypothetical protein
MKIKTNSHPSPLLPISLLSLIPSLVFGAGLAAIKEQTFHQDAGANVVAYSSLKNDGLSVKITSGSKAFTIEPKKLAGNIEVLPTLPAEIIADADLQPVRKAAKEYREFTARFPKSAPILANHISSLDNCIKEFEGGNARFNGKWMPKGEALATKQKDEQTRQSDRDATNQKLKEKMAFEEGQKAKGLAKYDGKWLPADEVMKLTERDQTALDKEVEAKVEAKVKAKVKAEVDQKQEQKWISENTFTLRGKITQFAGEGMLIHSDRSFYPAANYDHGKNRKYNLLDGDFFLVGHPDQKLKVDKDWFDVDAVPDGMLDYTTVTGASKRIRKFRVVKSYY